MEKLSVIVADDHPVVLEGIRSLFENESRYELVGTATRVEEMISICVKNYPQLLILDINLGNKNSLDRVSELKYRFPKMKIVIFSSYDNPGIVKRALDLKVDAYLLKDTTQFEWREALESIEKNEFYLSKALKKRETVFHDTEDMNDEFLVVNKISEQEKRIIFEVTKGLGEMEIADILGIKKSTVHSHKKNIMKKLGLHSNADIVRFAFENHMV